MTSVIVPVYNGGAILDRTVPALLALEAVDEWVWVDDGSKDDTPDRLNALITNTSNTCVLRLGENRGRGAARNAGVAAANGDRLVFFDADIEPPSDAALHLGEALAKPDAVASVARVHSVIDRPDDPYQRYLARHPRGPGSSGGQVAWRYFLSGACAIRRSVFNEARGFDEDLDYGEDFDLACRLSELSPSGLHVAETTVSVHDVGTLATALVNMRAFGSTLGRIQAKRPEALDLAGIPSSAARLARFAPIPFVSFIERTVNAVPQSLQPPAVRYALGLALLDGLRRA